MIKWEYLYHSGQLNETIINSFGAQGWEMVSFIWHPEYAEGGGFYVVIFKRPVCEEPIPIWSNIDPSTLTQESQDAIDGGGKLV